MGRSEGMTMPSLDSEERAAKQRDFYLKLVPQGGQILAQQLAGFLPPGMDSQEAEMRDAIKLWVLMHHSGAYPLVNDTAWWMTQFMDLNRRMARDEAVQRSNELVSYFIATFGQLLDKGIIQFTSEPEIPKIVTSSYDPINQDIEQALLDRMEAGLKKDEADE
jgi:hypothetical protein